MKLRRAASLVKSYLKDHRLTSGYVSPNGSYDARSLEGPCLALAQPQL